MRSSTSGEEVAGTMDNLRGYGGRGEIVRK